jgi:hypothetical protein
VQLKRLSIQGYEWLTLPLAIAMIGLTIIGGFKAYTPVPFWDMWNGYLDFFVNAKQGQSSAWWGQHNEHRIILSRLLFWLDLSLFSGLSIFLIVVNYFLLGLVAWLFFVFWREKTAGTLRFAGFALVAWLFSWSQENNLTWGFQSQFILAQLLPLFALYLMHLSVVSTTKGSYYFFLATFMGLLAAGSMANGIMALPLLCLFCLFSRSATWKTIFLALLSVATIVAYFFQYSTPSGHGSLTSVLMKDPIGYLRYVCAYLGSPFYYLVSSENFRLLVAQFAGLALILLSVGISLLWLLGKAKSTLTLALLCFLVYVGGTAFGTAGGRLLFGLDSAITSRYLTPALMAWAAIFVLVAKPISSRWVHSLLGLCLIILLAMLPYQLKALESRLPQLFEMEVGALALEIGVPDQIQIGNVFLNAQQTLTLAQQPVEQNLSVFGSFPWRDLREQIGNDSVKAPSGETTCKGFLDTVNIISSVSDYVRVNGWIFEAGAKSTPKLLKFRKATGETVGFAISGQNRPDVAQAVHKKAAYSGFKGYIKAENATNLLRIEASSPACQLEVKMPAVFFSNPVLPKESIISTTGVNAIVDNKGWTGSDFARSKIEGLQVLGSYVAGDSDVGEVVLNVNRGDKIMYRSGPTVGNQVIELLGTEASVISLPAAAEWTVLEFSSRQLPAQFQIRFADRGRGWGEWSAIALKK